MKPKRFLALGVLLAGVAAIAPFTKAQKSAPAQPSEQQKLKERVDALESQLKDAQAKADRAAMEKDYIERIQKEVNSYYEKAFNTQLLTVTIIALIVGLIGKFGVDHIVQSKLTETTTTLREEFRKELAGELQKLKDSNAAQLKQLEDTLTTRTEELGRDLNTRSGYGFYFVQGLAFGIGNQPAEALDNFRIALDLYKEGQTRKLFPKGIGASILKNIFHALEVANPKSFDEPAKKELADPIYVGLEEEFALAALDISWLAPLVKQRKDAASSAPQTAAATPAGAQAPAQKPKEPPSDN